MDKYMRKTNNEMNRLLNLRYYEIKMLYQRCSNFFHCGPNTQKYTQGRTIYEISKMFKKKKIN